MKARRQKTVISSQWQALLAWVVMLMRGVVVPAAADDLAGLCSDRAAIERVYYNHRLGQKPPFEQVSPPTLIERLVREDLRKQAVLNKVYRVDVTPAMLETEVHRINSTTRAPDMLAEIKAALGNDSAKFANVFAKPILVERLLRDKFENDPALHAPQRRVCEAVRNGLLAAKTNGATVVQLLSQLQQADANAVTETRWELGVRPAESNALAADELEVKKQFGPNAQLLASPSVAAPDRKFYFADLPPALQNVLRVQLRQLGDVSAVIETPGSFLVYLVREKSDTALAVACLALPKCSYEHWLNQQSEIP